jgi:hypothetical protein
MALELVDDRSEFDRFRAGPEDCQNPKRRRHAAILRSRVVAPIQR